MNKLELVKKTAKLTGETLKSTESTINAVLEALTETLVNKETCTLVGFGSFTPLAKAGRVGRNPRTGEPLDIPAKTIVKFKPGKALAEAVNS